MLGFEKRFEVAAALEDTREILGELAEGVARRPVAHFAECGDDIPAEDVHVSDPDLKLLGGRAIDVAVGGGDPHDLWKGHPASGEGVDERDDLGHGRVDPFLSGFSERAGIPPPQPIDDPADKRPDADGAGKQHRKGHRCRRTGHRFGQRRQRDREHPECPPPGVRTDRSDGDPPDDGEQQRPSRVHTVRRRVSRGL